MIKQRLGLIIQPQFCYSINAITYPQGVSDSADAQRRFRRKHFAEPGDDIMDRIPIWEWHSDNWMCYGEDVISYVVRQIREAHGQPPQGESSLD